MTDSQLGGAFEELDAAIAILTSKDELDLGQMEVLRHLLRARFEVGEAVRPQPPTLSDLHVRGELSHETMTDSLDLGERGLGPRVTVILAEAAHLADGKLDMLGAGWTQVMVPMGPSAVAMTIEVPWDQANTRKPWDVSLYDADGRSVLNPTPMGPQIIRFGGELEFGRPAGSLHGMPLSMALALMVPPLELVPNARYVWRATLGGECREGWTATFSTFPAPEPPR